jgi:hypothetical protein
MATAAVDGSERPKALGPTATHSSEEEQEMDCRGSDPPFTAPVCHVVPESLLVKMFEPTAIQSVGAGQATELTPNDPAGTDATDHEVPPLLDIRMTPMSGPSGFGAAPTAIQSKVLSQVTARRVVWGTGRV